MGYANVRVAATPIGDAAEKQLVERKQRLTGEVSVLGKKIEEAEEYLEKISTAQAEYSQIEEELEVLREEEKSLLANIDVLKEQAEDQRRLGDEIEAYEKRKTGLSSEISDAQLSLSKVREDIRLAEIGLADAKKKGLAQAEELKGIIVALENDVVANEAKLSTLRTGIERANASFEARSNELRQLEKEYSTVESGLRNAKSSLEELENTLVSKKRELGGIELEIAERRASFDMWVDGVSVALDKRELDLAAREGALSDRASMLDSRASKLREIKARLEHHMGTRLPDLIIE